MNSYLADWVLTVKIIKILIKLYKTNKYEEEILKEKVTLCAVFVTAGVNFDKWYL